MILIGLGSNLTGPYFDSPLAVLKDALAKMSECGIEIKALSHFYRTEPIPKSDQPWFVNAVAAVNTTLAAEELLRKLHEIEESLGRTRHVRWEARIVDLDIIAYEDKILPTKDLWQELANDRGTMEMIIPHPRLHDRLFVLKPLMDICPNWQHPVFGLTVSQLLYDALIMPMHGIIQRLS